MTPPEEREGSKTKKHFRGGKEEENIDAMLGEEIQEMPLHDKRAIFCERIRAFYRFD